MPDKEAEKPEAIEVPEDISALTQEELETLQTQLREAYAALRSAFDENHTEEVVQQLSAIAASLQRVTEELSGRGPSLDEQVAQLDAQMQVEPAEEEKPAEDNGEEKPAEEDKPAEEKPVEEEAQAAAIRPLRIEIPARSRPQPKANNGFAIVASSGQPLDNLDAVANELLRAHQNNRTAPQNGSVNIPVASIKMPSVAERLLGANAQENIDKINAVVQAEAVVAAGGLCAPLEAYYPLLSIESAERRVRGALTRFQASRGGIRFVAPPVIGDLTGAITHITVAQDSDGSTKDCLEVACDAETDVQVYAVSRCLTFNNWNDRFYPEQIRTFTEKAIVAQARIGDQELLDRVGTLSTAVTQAATYGATRTLLASISIAASGMRSRHRLGENVQLRVLLPAWAKEMVRTDLLRQAPGDSTYGVTDAQIDSWFAARRITAAWYLDSETGAGQVFGAQAAGALVEFPDTVVYYLFHEGAFLHLDGGTLDLGITRDSTSNQSNQFQVFAETFENVAFVGLESLKVTATLCPDGTYGPDGTAITC